MKKQSLNTQILKLFWQHAWKYPRYVISLFAILPFTILAHQFIPPLIAAAVLDRLSRGDFEPNQLWASFGTELLLYAATVILGGIVLWRIVVILIWKLEAKVVKDLNDRMFEHLTTLSARFHADSFGGSLVSRTSKLTSAYIRIADTTIFNIYTLVLALTFTTIILLPRAPLIVAVLLILTAFYVATAVFITKPVRKLTAIEAAAQNKTTGLLADMITNIMAVKSFGTSRKEVERFGEATESSRQKTMDVMRSATKRDLYFSTVTSSLLIASLIIAAASVVLYDANIGTVFLVLNYTSNIGQRLWEFSQSTLRQYNRAMGDAREAVETLNTFPTVRNAQEPESSKIIRGSVEFKGVSFKHEESDESLLFNNLQLRIKPGEKVGLVGPSGSGKTSLTKLVLRFSDINDGQILIDGQDISRLDQEELRRHIAYVPQEPLLFHRSLAENIGYGRNDASHEEIIAIAKMAHAHDFIEKLPNGYDTLVGERGVKLSGGQRQRVAIARAMLKNSPILILDEATSALDSESEALIQDALWKLMQNRTAIVIAHRLSTIQRMDRIIVLEDGSIAEEGSHRELINKQGLYASLWNHQSGGFIEE